MDLKKLIWAFFFFFSKRMFYKNGPEYFQQSVLHLTPRVCLSIQIKPRPWVGGRSEAERSGLEMLTHSRPPPHNQPKASRAGFPQMGLGFGEPQIDGAYSTSALTDPIACS